MIVELKNTWSYNESKLEDEELISFFKENGEFEEEVRDTTRKVKCKETGEEKEEPVTYYTYSYRYVGETNDIPVRIMNHKKVEKKFYASGLKVMSEKIGYNFDKYQSSGSNITIHMPSSELLAINLVTWMEDACTEQLQKQLDDGYRIIACLPQVGNRRPDYILGRIK